MRLAELTALLHLASPALPIGGFSYSQGLEAAVDAGIVTDAPSAGRWIGSGLDNVLARCELPFIAQQMTRWRALPSLAGGATGLTASAGSVSSGDSVGSADSASSAAKMAENLAFRELANADAWYLASRETAELRQETEQMGWSLASLCASLEWGDHAQRAALITLKPVSLPTVFAFAANAHGADIPATLTAYAFNWIENQVAAALKAVPLGQLAGQRILFGLHDQIAAAATRAAMLPPEALSTFSPLLGILSARHESQYSRLFRS